MSDLDSKPLIVTFHELWFMLRALHLNDKAWVDRLHDVWKSGTPTPDSRILVPRVYDERKVQPGNVEKRIIVPSDLQKWIVDICKSKGVEATPAVVGHKLKALLTELNLS